MIADAALKKLLQSQMMYARQVAERGAFWIVPGVLTLGYIVFPAIDQGYRVEKGWTKDPETDVKMVQAAKMVRMEAYFAAKGMPMPGTKPAAAEEEEEEEEEEELAVDIVDGVQLGTGARITCLEAWCCSSVEKDDGSGAEDERKELDEESTKKETTRNEKEKKHHRSDKHSHTGKVTIEDDALKRARELVASAKKIQTRKERKKKKQKRSR
mmetsp:Transcript_8368/g.23197  ORF Transcript_8368/g.23197 Transcript_8368/m.23197 type:complete len:212 (+) Transcript_8368:96-731(+)